MALKIACPNCGDRAFTEFWFGGELPLAMPVPGTATNPEAEYERIWLRRNVAGEQEERWFHYAGCRRWFTVQRDTRTNLIQKISRGGVGATNDILQSPAGSVNDDIA